MKNPNPINLATPDEVRKAGWQAETRDADGHLCRTHVPFETDEDIVWLVREAMEHGETVTIWPNSKIEGTPSPQHISMVTSDPIAWAEVYDEKIVTVQLDKSKWHTTPLYLSAPAEHVVPSKDDVRRALETIERANGADLGEWTDDWLPTMSTTEALRFISKETSNG